MAYKYSRGQRLVIKLESGQIFEGDCITCATNRIDVVDVVDCIQDIPLKHMSLSFYRNEIASVHVVHQENPNEEKELPGKQPLETACNGVDLTRTEYDRLKEITLEYSTYIVGIDNDYLAAVKYLSSCENIGVAILGNDLEQIKPISLLVLASWDHVYIFDLLSFPKKEFSPELKAIFESTTIKKVLHSSQPLVNCLLHCHGVQVDNIFDTQLSDEMIQKKQEECAVPIVRNLSGCLTHYFNLPVTLLETGMSITGTEWEERPLTGIRKINAAQFAVYLITLMNKQERIMLKTFYSAVDAYSHLHKNMDGYTALLNQGNKRVPDEILKIVTADL